MKELFEYSDILKSPIEAFYCASPEFVLPVEAHWHYFVEIIYQVEGRVRISCDEQSYELCPGMMLVIPPRCVHSIYGMDSKPFKYACVKFNPERLQLNGHYLPAPSACLRQVMAPDEPAILFEDEDFSDMSLVNYFDELVNEIWEKKYGYDAYVYSRLESLFVRLLRKWYDSGISLDADAEAGMDEGINAALLYIDKHSHENINVEELAHMCHMSYSYFAKSFHRYYGQSCKQYIEFIRLAKVENLLLFTDYDLNSIAAEVGFADCSHLIRCFKKRYGTTPKKYRMSRG